MRNQTYLIIAGFVILIAVFTGASVFFVSKITMASKDWLESSVKISDIEARQANFSKIKAELSSTENKMSEVKKAYLLQDEISGFISTLEKVAGLTGNSIKISNIAAPLKKGEASNINFKISLLGSYNNFLKFLANLEDIPYPPYRLVEITDISVSLLGDNAIQWQKELINVKSGDLVSIIGIKIYVK